MENLTNTQLRLVRSMGDFIGDLYREFSYGTSYEQLSALTGLDTDTIHRLITFAREQMGMKS